MRLARVEIRNWRCFRGEHVVDLDPGAHAIVARHERDAERSNWLGKSSFLWAIAFALSGVRPEDCRAEDDWISRGEAEGSVVAVLSDGTRIERSRRRGGPTALEVRTLDAAEAFRKAEAQSEIDRRLGLDASDAPVWFLAQKSFDRFVRARPGERAREVAEWLRIEPLQKAEASVRASLSTLLDEEATLARRESSDREALIALLSRHDIPTETSTADAIEMLARRERESSAEAERASKDASRLEHERTTEAEARAEARRAREREELARDAEDAERRAQTSEDEARAAEESAPGRIRLVRLRTRTERAAAASNAARRDAREKTALARGQFDGHCPVGGVRCPIASELNARERENAAAAQEGAENARRAAEAHENARSAEDAAKGLSRAAERARAKADVDRREADALRRRLEASPPIALPSFRPRSELSDELSEARERRDRARDGARDASRARAEVERLAERIDRTVRELAEIRKTRVTKLAAIEILGRRGAQRRIAEEALREVEDEANALLARAGVALSIRFSWQRETQGLAAQCEACGAAFPASTRVKECGRCGAARGPKLDERLDVELSDRSGAAEDLAGLAISLAASSRLRRERGSSWGLLCLDEPFGALDRAHRRALSRGLVGMLGDQWEQSLIVAHDEATLDAMPGRIVVTAGDDGSRVERA